MYMKCRYLKANRTTQSHIGMSQNNRTHAKTTVMSVLLLTEDLGLTYRIPCRYLFSVLWFNDLNFNAWFM